MEEALKNKEFFVLYQPKISLSPCGTPASNTNIEVVTPSLNVFSGNLIIFFKQ